MNDTQEAVARIALARFEARQTKEKAEKRSRHWRVAFLISQVVAGLGLAVWLQASHRQISGAQACAFFLIWLVGSAWGNYRANETMHSLQSEVARLREEIEERSA